MKRILASIACILLAVQPIQAQITLPETMALRPNRLGKLTATCSTQVRWINLHDDLDLIPDSSGQFVILQASKPGRYKIAAYTASKDGVPSEPSYCVIVVEGEVPPAPKPPPAVPPGAQTVAAICKLRFGNSGCTATIIGPRRSDGKWDVLTAAHCTGGVGNKGSLTLPDGRSYGVTVTVRQTKADITWMVAETTDATLPFAQLATTNPPVGVEVWHQGYGVDKPGNKEDGVVAAAQDSNGQIRFTLSVSSGDSGGGIFRTDTNELVGVVCCTASMAKKGAMWGGSPTMAKSLRPGAPASDEFPEEVIPFPIPIREEEDRFMPFVWLP